jgi:hypothetical protein
LIKAKEERRDGLVEAVGLARKELQELTAA